MFFLDEIPMNMVKNKNVYLPINDKDRKKGSAAILLSPNYESSDKIMHHNLINFKYYDSYFIRKSALYYIDGTEENIKESSNILLEDYEKLFGDPEVKFIFRGLNADIKEVSNTLNDSVIREIKNSLSPHIHIPKTIKCEVYRGGQLREPTENILYIESYYTFDMRRFKDYERFCKFSFIVFLIKRQNPYINKSLLYAISLVESGLYPYYGPWPFNSELEILCEIVYKANKGSRNDLYKNLYLRSKSNVEIIKMLNKYIGSDLTVSNVLDILNTMGIYEGSSLYSDSDNKFSIMNESILQINDNEGFLFESANDNYIKQLLFKERMKSNNEVKAIYEKVKANNSSIRYTYLTIDRYKSLNLIYDTYFYNELYMRNSTFKNIKGYNVYYDLMNRLILDKEIPNNGYNNRTVIIPVKDWDNGNRIHMIQDGINPISCIYKTIIDNPTSLPNKYKDILFLFLGDRSYFTLDFSKVDLNKVKNSFIRNIKHILSNSIVIQDEDNVKSSPKAIKTDIIDKIEKTQNIEIKSIDSKDIEVKNEEDKNKQKLVDKIDTVSKTSSDEDIAMDKLDDDEVKDILDLLSTTPDNGPKVSGARASRNLKLKNDLLTKEIKGKSIKDLLADEPIPEYDSTGKNIDVEPLDLEIDSVNDEWKELKFVKMDDDYDIDADIVKVFNSLSRLSYPLFIRDIKVENTSTSEDAIETYEVKLEDNQGDRFTIKIDVPLFIDGKYLKLRGNRKEIPNQLFLMPIIKTDEDTVQIVSNYKKIFVSRHGAGNGKSIIPCGKLIKTLTKNKYPNIKYTEGMNRKVSSKYELPIDYIDLGNVFNTIEANNYTFYFNQDELRNKYGSKVDDSKGVPFGYDNKNNTILYYNSSNGIFSDYLASLISSSGNTGKFYEDYENASKSTKYTYSRASIMAVKIPLIVLCAYHEGLDTVLKKANINYKLSEERPKDLPKNWDYIKFKDGYLSFEVDYDSSLLLNGLRDCPVYDTSITELNNRITYLGYLDNFGGRIISDGLDNYYDLMIDINTYELLKSYKLPTDYISVLLYANQLLADNKFIKHTDIAGTRQVKRKQQIVDLLYEVLTKQYARYANAIRHGRTKTFSVKQSALIDEFMKLNTTSDLSINNPMGEYESYNTITPKGHSGMNADRAYSLDKRSFDESMMNVLSSSTGFSGNVGINRQLTIDANVDKYGRILSNKDNKDLNPVKSLCMTEALTPFGSTNDDPFRTAMNFVQSSKHSMRCEDGDPLLITTGADEALPYLTSNTFSFKSKDAGTVIEKTDDYMVLEYKDGTHDFIDLSNQVEKNSANGIYLTLKLSTNLKQGDKFDKNSIVAYDNLAYSNKTGSTDDISYNIGPLVKIAILNTDEGYEDSAIISDKLSDRMATDIVMVVSKAVPKDSNIYNMVKEGQEVKEGDTLFTIQAASDDEYVDQVLRNLSDTDEDMINELGRVNIKADHTGIVEKISIKRTCRKEELSETALKLFNKYEYKVNKTKSVMKKYGIDTSMVPSTDKLDNQGKLKKTDGLYIEIYIKYRDRMSIGDKLIYYSAVKGVVKDIFPKGDEPYSEYNKEEKIDSLLALGGINARMAMAGMKSGAINKGIINLTRQCKEILGLE